MRKSLTLLAAAALLAALGACNRQPAGVTPDDERELNNTATMLDDNVIDTSPDDAAANVEDVVEENAVETPPAGNGQ